MKICESRGSLEGVLLLLGKMRKVKQERTCSTDVMRRLRCDDLLVLVRV